MNEYELRQIRTWYKGMTENIWTVVGGTMVMSLAFVVIVPCLLAIPFVWLAENRYKKLQKLCPHCANKDREQWMELTYNREIGTHHCSKCNTDYKIERSYGVVC